MAYSYIAVFACLILSVHTTNALEVVNGTIKITIGTTSGCWDTVRFINDQLVDAYSQYRNFLDIEFVPWGRTRYENGSMLCQFGVNDCWANRLHRCALNLLRNDQPAQLRYMQCEFSPPYPAFSQGSYSCALAIGLRLIDVDNCVSRPYDELDWAAQEAAREPMQIINFVPSISFNGQHNVVIHNEARRRLPSMLCFALAAVPGTNVVGCTI